MLSVLTWVSGRTLKKAMKQSDFMPRYVEERKPSEPKSLEQQQKEFAAFAAKLKAVQGK